MKLWPAINKPGDTIDVLGVNERTAELRAEQVRS